MTLNEISSFIQAGHVEGRYLPGLRLPPAQVSQARHHAVLAHGLGVQAIRASAKPGTRVGIADSVAACVPVFETSEHIAAAAKAYRELNAGYLTSIMEGRYINPYLNGAGADGPTFTADDMAAIGSRLDFVGLNVYQPVFIRAAEGPTGFAVVPPPSSFPHMMSSWLHVGPEALYWSPKLATQLWGIQEIYITENGASSTDTITSEGHVYDVDRIMFLRNYLTQLHRAVSEGVPVHGYFLWSLLDNFEWANGFSYRFGLYYVDFSTQERIPKLSASFYKEVIARNDLA
jgi:beta-glucosidase